MTERSPDMPLSNVYVRCLRENGDPACGITVTIGTAVFPATNSEGRSARAVSYGAYTVSAVEGEFDFAGPFPDNSINAPREYPIVHEHGVIEGLRNGNSKAKALAPVTEPGESWMVNFIVQVWRDEHWQSGVSDLRVEFIDDRGHIDTFTTDHTGECHPHLELGLYTVHFHDKYGNEYAPPFENCFPENGDILSVHKGGIAEITKSVATVA